MFAILVTPENMPKIKAANLDPAAEILTIPALTSTAKWYMVTGYYQRGGRWIGDTMIPAYILETLFDYNPVKIKTDWDQIVRK